MSFIALDLDASTIESQLVCNELSCLDLYNEMNFFFKDIKKDVKQEELLFNLFIDFLFSQKQPINLISHNSAFDKDRVILPKLLKYNLELPTKTNFICTLKLSRSLFQDTNHSLADCCRKYKIPYEGVKTTLKNAKVTGLLYIQLLENHGQFNHSEKSPIKEEEEININIQLKTEPSCSRAVWKEEEEFQLLEEMKQQLSIKDIALLHNRTEGSIRARLPRIVALQLHLKNDDDYYVYFSK